MVAVEEMQTQEEADEMGRFGVTTRAAPLLWLNYAVA